MGGHSENPQALPVYLHLSTAGPGWPRARARAAGCTHQLRKSKLPASGRSVPLPLALTPLHTHTYGTPLLLQAPALPSHPLRQELCCWTGTFWMRECEAITCQEHFRLIIFPNIWTYGEKNNLLLNGSFGFLQVCIFNRQL